MSVIVRDTGFHADDWHEGFAAWDSIPANTDAPVVAVDVPPDAEITGIGPQFDAIALIRIDFPSFADGRGFTLARNLRRAGYTGRLRAKGHVIADQYAMARRAGFDEVEIDEDLAARQPEAQWMRRADWQRP